MPSPSGAPSLIFAELDPNETLIEADRADNLVQGVVGMGRVAPNTLVLVNPSLEPLRNAPVEVDAAKLPDTLSVDDASEATLPAQIDALPTGRRLVVMAPFLPARSAVAYRLSIGKSILSKAGSGPDRDIDLPGQFELRHDRGTGNLLDKVSLDGVPLGSLKALLHQSRAQNLWVPTDTIDSITAITGSVRTVLLFVASLRHPASAGVKTEAGKDGTYAQRETVPGMYTLHWQIASVRGESWYGSRFLSVTNCDTVPWRMKAYYHYPLSAIGGNAADDQPAGTTGEPTWHDAALGADYGALLDTARYKSVFWKNTPDGVGEHADIWRELGRELQPGETVRASAEDTEVVVFGAIGNTGASGSPTLRRTRAIRELRVTLVQPGSAQTKSSIAS